MDEKLLQLPFEVQAVLAIGYVAYRLATTGSDRGHRTGDFLFQILVYGAVAKAAQEVAVGLVGYAWSFAVAVVTALAVAALWRAVGRRLVVWALRALRVTRENYYPSTWTSIIDGRHPWHYVSVRLEDGTYLDSDIAALPSGLPHEPLDVDTDGNVAIYVTGRTDPDGKVTEYGEAGVLDADGRSHLTYVPSARISRVTVSLGGKRANRFTSSAGEVETTA